MAKRRFPPTPPPDPYPDRLAAGRVAGEIGMRMSAAAADALWKYNATTYLLWHVQRYQYLFTDELWGRVPGIPDDDPEHRRALGAIVTSLKVAGVIKDSGQTRPRSFGHGAGGRVWESFAYDPRFNDPAPIPI